MPLDLPAPAGRLVGRRAVVTTLAGLTAVAVTGCDVGSPAIDAPGHREDDADLPLVREAVALCDGILARIEATAAGHPDLAVALGPVVAMHRAHRAALEDAASSSANPSADSSATTTVPDGRGRALAELRNAERPVCARLAALAQKADSGALARLLASMAAGISQRLADWPA